MLRIIVIMLALTSCSVFSNATEKTVKPTVVAVFGFKEEGEISLFFQLRSDGAVRPCRFRIDEIVKFDCGDWWKTN
jgi:hypothetical protein